jgi:hypothetical protein
MDMQNYLTKPKSGTTNAITPNLKRAIWDVYVGAALQEAPCLLCRRNPIYRISNSGFQAAHVVARRFFDPSDTKISVFYVIPSCAACNNDMGDMNLFDYLYTLNRMHALRSLLLAVYKMYMEQHHHAMPVDACNERLIFNVLQHLYGKTRFPLGGHIENTNHIYQIARIEQLNMLVEEALTHTIALQRLANEQRLLMEAEIKPQPFQ